MQARISPTIVAWLLLWILASDARGIPAKRHSMQHNRELPSNSNEEDISSSSSRLLSSQQRMDKKSQPIQDDSSDVSIRSNELNDGYDEYPIVTPKRAAMLLDRIMVALHHALESEDGSTGRKINDVYRDGHYYGTSSAAIDHGDSKAVKDKSSHRALGRSRSVFSGHKVQHSANDEISDSGNDDFPEDVEVRSLSGEDEEYLVPRDNTMDLQRRGHDVSTGSGANAGGIGKGRVYWRCYFNAVTCF